MNAPLDGTHVDSMRARDQIRQHVLQIRTTIQHWQPRPCFNRKEYP
jgi:hypothetical protein